MFTDHQMRQFSAAYVNSGDRIAAYRLIRPKTKSDEAADKGARRMLERKVVQDYVAKCRADVSSNSAKVLGQLTVYDQQTDSLLKTISITEVQLINEYVTAAMLDHLSFYKDGQPIPLEELAPELRRQIQDIEWEQGPGNTRRVRDYVLEDRSKARDQLAKITGIVNPAFDFAGLLALMTGKKPAEAAEDLRRLDHSKGVNFEAIQRRAGVIEGEYTEVKNV
jgi:hypothetical protein